jgi:hypothetical protein
MVMSALPPKADMCSALVHVRFGPKADITSLFDHLIGERDQSRRNSKAEGFGGLEIDHEFKFCRPSPYLIQQWRLKIISISLDRCLMRR